MQTASLSSLSSGFQLGLDNGDPWWDMGGGHEVGAFILLASSGYSSCGAAVPPSLSLPPSLSALVTAHPHLLIQFLMCLLFPTEALSGTHHGTKFWSISMLAEMRFTTSRCDPPTPPV